MMQVLIPLRINVDDETLSVSGLPPPRSGPSYKRNIEISDVDVLFSFDRKTASAVGLLRLYAVLADLIHCKSGRVYHGSKYCLQVVSYDPFQSISLYM